MKDLTNISRVYFIGIGGIGMSAIARYFLSKNVAVSGYDKTPTPLSRQLESEGMHIHYEDNLDLIDKNADLVVYTPAIRSDHKELDFYRKNEYELAKRSDVLEQITNSSFNICIAGTHGKTTISTMVAYILRKTDFGCNAFLGGISVNYHTNFWSSEHNVSVVEADEYDRSFLKLSPDIAVITAMDADHLDIYGSHDQLTESFRQFASQLKENGTLIYHEDLPLTTEGITYSGQGPADVKAVNIRVENGSFYFDFKNHLEDIRDIKLGIAGIHNIENATAAIEVALKLDIEPALIKRALESFKGVKRRFEYIVKSDKHIYIDDYAHHPEELRAAISSIKRLYPDKKLTTIFQPHLYTRTRDFADGFAGVLDMSDELILLDIYPARELPIEGVTSDLILSRMQMLNKRKCGKQEAVDLVRIEKPELLLTVGAGDIDQLVQPLKKALENV